MAVRPSRPRPSRPVPRASRAPRPIAPPDGPLTRDRIAGQALALIDDAGLEACSMRRLGARLGVEGMAIYHHFPSKGALLDAVMDLLAQEIAVPDEEPPLERLRTSLRSYRAIALRHPHAFVLLATRRFNSPAAFGVYERLLATFAELGLDARESARWFRLTGTFVNGHGLSEVASREQEPDATPLALQHEPGAIPLPHVRAAAPHLRVDALEEVFEWGLTVLLDTLAARVGARTRRGVSRAAGAPRP